MAAAAPRSPAAPRRVLVAGDPAGLALRGGNRSLWESAAPEVMLAGPSETGKTMACLAKLDALLTLIPGAQAVLVRKIRDTIFPTVLQTYTRLIQPFAGGQSVNAVGVRRYGGERPLWFDYPGGSRLWLAGIDDPGKALSSDRDFIYVNQAEELTPDDWQVLTTRATGRAGYPHPQVFGDCNPGPPHHWIRHRPTLRILESRHEDNPILWDADAREWTEQGRRTLAVLDALTGVRKERLRYGRWVSAEGVVFELDPRRHVLSRAALVGLGILTADGAPGPAVRERIAGVDWGYTAPGCLQVWLADGDGCAYLVREWYRPGQLIGWWVARGREAFARYGVTAFASDPSQPGSLEEFRRAGLPAVAADNDRSAGIQAVQQRLADAGDGRPRLFVADDALADPDPELLAARQPCGLLQEADSLVWAPDRAGRPAKEGTTVGPDHACDSARYAIRLIDQRFRVGAAVPTFGGRSAVAAAPAGVFRAGGASPWGRLTDGR
jgi:hypothetical protein